MELVLRQYLRDISKLERDEVVQALTDDNKIKFIWSTVALNIDGKTQREVLKNDRTLDNNKRPQLGHCHRGRV